MRLSSADPISSSTGLLWGEQLETEFLELRTSFKLEQAVQESNQKGWRSLTTSMNTLNSRSESRTYFIHYFILMNT